MLVQDIRFAAAFSCGVPLSRSRRRDARPRHRSQRHDLQLGGRRSSGDRCPASRTATDRSRARGPRRSTSISYPNYADFRDRRPSSVEGCCCSLRRQRCARATRLTGRGASGVGNYFDVLGVVRLRPDVQSEEDRTPGTHPVAVLSMFLGRRFGSTDRRGPDGLNRRSRSCSRGSQVSRHQHRRDRRLWVGDAVRHRARRPVERPRRRCEGAARLAPGATVRRQAGLAVVAGHIADACRRPWCPAWLYPSGGRLRRRAA
jgi:hypothetical protein